MNIGKIFNLESPSKSTSTFQDQLKQFSEYAGVPRTLTSELKQFTSVVTGIPTLMGLEIEVENMNKDISLPPFWIQEGDGSLRNHGREYKSVPLSPDQSIYALAILWHVLNKGVKPDFSWRTSIHVHINAIEMSHEEFTRFVVLSTALEPVFFALVGQDREQSNFCVPLGRSNLFDSIIKLVNGRLSVKKFHHLWNTGSSSGDHSNGMYKYSAVNFSRLGDIGTIEFRHLGGTKNLNLVALWVSLIAKVYDAAIEWTDAEVRKHVLALSSDTACKSFVANVFGSALFSYVSSLSNMMVMSSTAARMKELYVTPPKFKGVSPTSSLAEYAKHAYGKSRVREDTPVKKNFM